VDSRTIDPDKDKQHEPELRFLGDDEDETVIRQRMVSINIKRAVPRGDMKPPVLFRSSVGLSSVGMDTCKAEKSDHTEAVRCGNGHNSLDVTS